MSNPNEELQLSKHPSGIDSPSSRSQTGAAPGDGDSPTRVRTQEDEKTGDAAGLQFTDRRSSLTQSKDKVLAGRVDKVRSSLSHPSSASGRVAANKKSIARPFRPAASRIQNAKLDLKNETEGKAARGKKQSHIPEEKFEDGQAVKNDVADADEAGVESRAKTGRAKKATGWNSGFVHH